MLLCFCLTAFWTSVRDRRATLRPARKVKRLGQSLGPRLSLSRDVWSYQMKQISRADIQYTMSRRVISDVDISKQHCGYNRPRLRGRPSHCHTCRCSHAMKSNLRTELKVNIRGVFDLTGSLDCGTGEEIWSGPVHRRLRVLDQRGATLSYHIIFLRNLRSSGRRVPCPASGLRPRF
jgi:hypothetical protein